MTDTIKRVRGLCGEDLARLVDYAEELINSPAWWPMYTKLTPQAQADVMTMLTKYRGLCGEEGKLFCAYWRTARSRGLQPRALYDADQFEDRDVNKARQFLRSIIPRANKRLQRELGTLARTHAVMYGDRVVRIAAPLTRRH